MVWEAPLNPLDFGATWDGTTDDSGAIQDCLDAAATALQVTSTDTGGDVYLPPGRPVVNQGLVLNNTASRVSIRGSGRLTTTLRRTSGTATMLAVSGSTSGRARASIEGVTLNGGGSAGTLLDLVRASDVLVDDVKLMNTDGNALHCKQVFNSHINNLWVSEAGTGTTDAAVLFDGFDENQGASDTVFGVNWQLEANTGTDVKMTGAGTFPTNKVFLTNLKIEGGSGAFPCIDLPYAQIAMTNVSIGNVAGRTVTPVQQVGSANFYPNIFQNLGIDGTQPYLVDHAQGRLTIIGGLMNGWTTAAVRIQGSVPAGYFVSAGLTGGGGQFGPTLFLDGRTPKEYPQWLRGSVAWDPQNLVTGAGETKPCTVTGAVLGDKAIASMDVDLQGVILHAWVSAADTVTARLFNNTGTDKNIAAGTLRAEIRR